MIRNVESPTSSPVKFIFIILLNKGTHYIGKKQINTEKRSANVIDIMHNRKVLYKKLLQAKKYSSKLDISRSLIRIFMTEH